MFSLNSYMFTIKASVYLVDSLIHFFPDFFLLNVPSSNTLAGRFSALLTTLSRATSFPGSLGPWSGKMGDPENEVVCYAISPPETKANRQILII